MRVRNGVLLLIVLLMATPVFASRVPNANRMTDVELLAQFNPAEIADYRIMLEGILTMQSEMIAASGRSVTTELTNRRLATVRNASDADLARLMAADVDLTLLHAQTKDLYARTIEPRRHKIQTDTSGLPVAPYSFCGSERFNSEAMFAAWAVLEAADAVWSAASRACDEVIVVAGFGGNVSLVCIIADAVLCTAKGVYEGFVWCDDEVNSAEIAGSYDRIGHVHGDIEGVVTNDDANMTTILNNDDSNMTSILNNDDSNMTSIVNNDNVNTTNIVLNDNSNKDTIVANDNANKDTILANANGNQAEMLHVNDVLQTLMLEMNIEENLQAGDGKQLALFMLPAADGGYLEVAISIVQTRMNQVKAAGGNIHDAQNKFNEAMAKLALGNFKECYKKLCAAYNELSKY